jgi:hypothetical protein
VWYEAGSTGPTDFQTFQFAPMPSVFIDRGTAAKYSVAQTDNVVFWLTQDRGGTGSILVGDGYQANPISTHAMEVEFTTYPRIDDAIGMTYQLGGHRYYVIAFPHADKTWAYDLTTKEWHELVWLDTNGTEHRHRANCVFTGYGQVVCGDWENGNLYAFDLSVYTDNGAPIIRKRMFPHLLSEGKRLFHKQVLLDIETGTGGNQLPEEPQVFLAWSDDRGHLFSNPVGNSIGASGEYLSSVQFQRLGLARDRVYSVFWSTPYRTCLQGAWLTVTPAQS